MSDAKFELFFQAYPKRKGDRGKEGARIKFLKLVAAGDNPDMIIGAARAFHEVSIDRHGTEFIPMAQTWLHQRRFMDYHPIAAKKIEDYDAIAARHGYTWNGEKYVKSNELG